MKEDCTQLSEDAKEMLQEVAEWAHREKRRLLEDHGEPPLGPPWWLAAGIILAGFVLFAVVLAAASWVLR